MAIELGRVDSHAKHDEGCGKVDESEVVSGSFFVTRSDASVVLDAVDESFREVAGFVFSLVPAAFRPTVAARWNDRFGTALANYRDEFVGVISFVGDDAVRLMRAEQFFRTVDIMFLPRTKANFHRLPLGIYGKVELGTKSASRSSQGFVGGLFFCEPAACW